MLIVYLVRPRINVTEILYGKEEGTSDELCLFNVCVCTKYDAIPFFL